MYILSCIKYKLKYIFWDSRELNFYILSQSDNPDVYCIYIFFKKFSFLQVAVLRLVTEKKLQKLFF